VYEGSPVRIQVMLLAIILSVLTNSAAHAETEACSGCCSSHGGITSSCAADGRIYCKDGTVSPTCLCSSCGVAPPPPNCTGGRIWTGFACACPTGQVFTDTQCYAPVTVTEFFALGLNHYFITANDDEVTALNAPGTGWMPTGQTFKAYLRNVRPASAHSVCRFYGDFVIGPNSHFYTGEQAECDSLKALQAATPLGVPRWNFEEPCLQRQRAGSWCMSSRHYAGLSRIQQQSAAE